MNLKKILDDILPCIKETGAFQLSEQKKLSLIEIRDKGLNQLVSHVDIQSEIKLVECCRKAFPEAAFITEENTLEEQHKSDYNWIIDPLDGTTNFLHGLQVYSISVALVHQNKPVLGVVHCPAMDQCFTSIIGDGAKLNDHSIAVSKNANLKDSLIATGFPYTEFDGMQNYLNLLEYLMKNTHGLRRMGSAAIDLCYTAMGIFDSFYETNLNAWDVAAGALIVQEAGGVVSDFSNTSNYLFGKQIVAGNKQVQAELLAQINHFSLS